MEEAARSGDVRALFQLASHLTPKQPRRRLQLRGPAGEIWTSTQQIRALTDFYLEVYAPQDEPVLQPSQLTHNFQAPSLDVEEWARRLLELPLTKATPKYLAPSAAFVACSDILAGWLAKYAAALGHYPSIWVDSWLTLVPKVRVPTLPKQLRPIGLTEATGRAFAGYLQDAIRPYVCDYIGTIPEMAYLPGRNTGMAIRRVVQHCMKALQTAALPLGGLQLSLDLTQAFDRLSWTLVHASMLDAQIPLALRGQVLDYYRRIGYHLQQGEDTAIIHAKRGVKQGCKVAPLLWSLCTGLLFRRLAARTSSAWVQQALNAFADDLHLGQTVCTGDQLERALAFVGHLLDVLTEARLVVNQTKSAVLISLPQTFAKRWKRRCYVKREEGMQLRIRTPGGRVFEIPIVEKHPYLGVVITYGDVVQLTAQHRTQLAWTAWGRLRPLLTSAQAPSLRHRLRLWRACIPPILLYGMDCMPITGSVLRLLQGVLTRQLRAVAKSQAHLAQETTLSLHSRLRVPLVLDVLKRAASKCVGRIPNLPAEARDLTLISAEWAAEVQEALLACDDARSQGAPDSVTSDGLPLFGLPLCGAIFQVATGPPITGAWANCSPEVLRPALSEGEPLGGWHAHVQVVWTCLYPLDLATGTHQRGAVPPSGPLPHEVSHMLSSVCLRHSCPPSDCRARQLRMWHQWPLTTCPALQPYRD